MTTDELEREKRRLLERITDQRRRMSDRTADVRRSLSPARTLGSVMGRVLPLVRPMATLVGSGRRVRRGRRGKLGAWLRLGLAATVLVPVVRSLLTHRDES